MSQKSATNCRVRPGREKALLRHHPWVFSGALTKNDLDLAAGSIVDVTDERGKFLARGFYNLHSQIRVRILTWNSEEPVDRKMLADRMHSAHLKRESVRKYSDSYRLVHAEADLLPGLIIDVYGGWVVLQILSAGWEAFRASIVEILRELYPNLRGVFERSDDASREWEGLEKVCNSLFELEELPDKIEICQNGLKFLVDIRRGHKTGFYLDQTQSRQWLTNQSAGKEVLNCFSFSGGFTVAAFKGGATHVTSVDSSSPALELLTENLTLNGFESSRSETIQADVFQQLRALQTAGKSFDIIILDPPKFAHSPTQVEKAARGYKDLNLQALKLLRKGGLLMTFSCSGAISLDLFQKIVFGATVDAGCDGQILKCFTQSEDHPVLLSFPESLYLKGFAIRKM